MIIELSNVSHRFGSNWVLKNINQQFLSDHKYAILGPNGSGKSTLLKIIATALSPTKGTVAYNNSSPVLAENIYKSIALAAPYSEILEELTIIEFFAFYQSFKNMRDGFSIDFFLSEYGFTNAKKKFIHQFSSGMKQRLKLAVAIETASEVLLLDEPFSNLDEETINLFSMKISQLDSDRLLIMASNNKIEYQLCDQFIELNS